MKVKKMVDRIVRCSHNGCNKKKLMTCIDDDYADEILYWRCLEHQDEFYEY